MKTPIEDAWVAAAEKASLSPPAADDYIIFRVGEHSDRSCFGGVDSEGCNLLAIEVKAVPPLIEIGSAELDYFRHERRAQRSWLMVFRLKSKSLASVFATLCQDLIDEIGSVGTEQALLNVVEKRIALWQRLFANGPDGVLADFQIKGLLAELLYMESQMAVGDREPAEIVLAWVGPSGGNQDFIFSDAAVEIKAVGPNAEGVTINSLRQLDSPYLLRLHVWTMRPASADEARAETLDRAIARVESYVAGSQRALMNFRSALLESGYVAHPRYGEVAFEPMGVEEFLVDADFPRLTSSSVPEGIAKAEYVVSLQSIRAMG